MKDFKKKRYTNIKELYKEIRKNNPEAELKHDTIHIQTDLIKLYEGMVTLDTGRVKTYYV